MFRQPENDDVIEAEYTEVLPSLLNHSQRQPELGFSGCLWWIYLFADAADAPATPLAPLAWLDGAPNHWVWILSYVPSDLI